MQYRSEVISVTGFVKQIACSFLRHGYWFYVTGCIPAGKDARSIDRKLVEKYGIAMSESTRARRKQLGFANLQYIRHDRFFAILATKGQHHFFVEEAVGIRDIRRVPLQFAGYSISYRRGGRTRDGERDQRWHSHVEIERGRFLEIKAHFLHLAVHRSPDNLALAFYDFPFEPYAPVRRRPLLMRTPRPARAKITRAGDEFFLGSNPVVREFASSVLSWFWHVRVLEGLLSQCQSRDKKRERVGARRP
jgi:hypothetical protein